MTDWTHLFRAIGAAGEPDASMPPWKGWAQYASFDTEYQAASAGVGLVDRTHRGLLEITGADRAAWLHNLTTNEINRLGPGDGHYCFALDVKGRILFDLNAMVLPQALWVDVDVRWLDRAQAHFAKYTVVEDVTVTDRTDEFLRVSLVGPDAGGVMSASGAPNASIAPYLQVGYVEIQGTEVAYFRHDLFGVYAADLLIPAVAAEAVLRALLNHAPTTLVGYDATDTLRIESGIPWPMAEIAEDVLPAETGQLHRAVSRSKGCYLGQEIVERMRSRGSIARRLVMIRCDAPHVPPIGAAVLVEPQSSTPVAVGQVTSACHSPKHGAPLLLAYARTPHAGEGERIRIEWSGRQNTGRVIPFAGNP